MDNMLILASTVVLLSSLVVTGFVGTSFSQNQTNMTTSATNETGAMMGNQTENGIASGIENLTGGGSGTPILQNNTNILNTSQQQNQTAGGQQNQTEGGNDTLGQIGESIGKIFGQ